MPESLFVVNGALMAMAGQGAARSPPLTLVL
jgi:hypothetical protein